MATTPKTTVTVAKKPTLDELKEQAEALLPTPEVAADPVKEPSPAERLAGLSPVWPEATVGYRLRQATNFLHEHGLLTDSEAVALKEEIDHLETR